MDEGMIKAISREADRDKKLDDAFRSGSVYRASDEELHELINICCTGVPNENVRHRQIVRGLAINHVLLSNLIARLNAQNVRFGWLVLALAVVSCIATVAQVVLAML